MALLLYPIYYFPAIKAHMAGKEKASAITQMMMAYICSILIFFVLNLIFV